MCAEEDSQEHLQDQWWTEGFREGQVQAQHGGDDRQGRGRHFPKTRPFLRVGTSSSHYHSPRGTPPDRGTGKVGTLAALSLSAWSREREQVVRTIVGYR